MVVFTCVTKQDEDAAVIWAASLARALATGKGGVLTYIFHTPDVNTSRFSDFNVNSIAVNVPADTPTEEMYVHVLDMMIERKFADKVFYATVDSLWNGNMDELLNCPLNDRVWLAARAEYVYFDNERNSKFYEHYDPKFWERRTLGSQQFFSDDVMLIQLKGLQQSIRRKGNSTLVEYMKVSKHVKGHSVQYMFNTLLEEYVNLFDRYNAFSETYINLDFGELLGRRADIRNSKVINFRGIDKPWREVTDFDLPELSGSQYPYDLYLAACSANRTYLTKDFFEKVKANAKRYSMMSMWEGNVLPASRRLKDKLTKFKEDLSK